MDNQTSMYVDANQVMKDWGVSKSKAYAIIRELSRQMKKDNPSVLTIAGKVNRVYYEQVCLMNK